MAVWGHDHIMPLFGRFNATLGSPPAHDCGIGGQATLQDLIPTNDASSLAIDMLFYALYKITLQSMLILQVVFLIISWQNADCFQASLGHSSPPI